MARRGENIYKRKDGRWEGRLLLQKGKYQYLYGKSYKEVKEKMRFFHEETNDLQKKQTLQKRNVAESLEAWLEGDIQLQVKRSTYESYYYCIQKHVLPFFRLNENQSINSETIQRFVKMVKMNTSLAESSKKKLLSIFKICLKELLKDTPDCISLIKSIQLPKPEYKEVKVFSVKEQHELETIVLHSVDKRVLGVILCFYTGIRLGELCALKWSDFDMETGMMSISRTVFRTKNFTEETKKTQLLVGAPKSRKSIRKIPVPEFLLELIKEADLCPPNGNCYVFSGTDIPLDPRRYQKLFKNLLSKANLQYRKFHTTRHTFATRALELGVDIKTLSEMLGHTDVSITLNIYAHSLMGHKKEAIDKLNHMHVETMKFVV